MQLIWDVESKMSNGNPTEFHSYVASMECVNLPNIRGNLGRISEYRPDFETFSLSYRPDPV
jgi:hypothetical protein